MLPTIVFKTSTPWSSLDDPIKKETICSWWQMTNVLRGASFPAARKTQQQETQLVDLLESSLE